MNKNILRRLTQVFLTLLLQGVILFLAAGTVQWKWAWIFLALGVFILLINLFAIPREVIEERGKAKKNVKKWDKVINAINIVPTILLYIFCGLDFRFNWTDKIDISVKIVGLVLVLSGSLIFTWSMVANRFFSTLVRLQTDREHSVASGGPYRFVRHPGYVGYIIMSFATPLALGTLWGLPFSAITIMLFIIRTALEDNTLIKELAGYMEYSKKTKYRLVPFLW